MKIGKALKIFFQISSEKYTDSEKGEAIMHVIQLPTYNGVKKDAMACVIWYLLNLCFELPENVKPPMVWEELEKALKETEEDK